MRDSLTVLFVLALLLVGGCMPIAAPEQEPADVPVASDQVTGIAEVDAVITTILAQDQTAIAEHVRFTALPCTLREGLGGPPKCGEGQAEGTVVNVLPMMGTSASYLAQDEIANLQLEADALYAVYEIPAATQPFGTGWPVGEYAIVFTSPGPSPFSLTVVTEGDSVVRTFHKFTESMAEAIPEGASVVYLAE